MGFKGTGEYRVASLCKFESTRSLHLIPFIQEKKWQSN